ncbi:MAG: GDSL-type esterase/lipase family protein [Ruthenibacterium sp.]
MSSYKEFQSETKRKRGMKIVVCLCLVTLIIALLTGIAYVASRMLLGKSLLDAKDILPLTQPVSSSVASGAPLPSEEAAAKDVRLWNTMMPLDRTINFEMMSVDSRMLSLPQNGRVSRDYFKTALFIGDSITQGMDLYDDALPDGATQVCAYLGIGPKQILENSVGKRRDKTEVAMWDDICAKTPQNIYILLGTNALVSQTDESISKFYGDLLDKLRTQFPKIPIYVQAITPVTADTAAKRPNMANDRIRLLNNALCQIVLSKGMYYVNIQEAIANVAGDLPDEIAGTDGYHLQPEGYRLWIDYLSTHTAYSPYNVPFLTEPYNS